MPPTIRGRVNQELIFGAGPLNAGVDWPNPDFCNLKLSIACVMYASGAAEVLDKFFRDREKAQRITAGLGVHPELDDTFFNNLELLGMIASC